MTESPRNLLDAVESAAQEAKLSSRDVGAYELARRYARALDDSRGTADEADTLKDLGPKLLATLTALGLTLAGRGTPSVRGGVSGDARPGTAAGTLALLRAQHGRAARDQRTNGAAQLDEAAS